MFDCTFPPVPSAPVPPRPAALDTRTMMPLLRAIEAEAAVEVLASATGANAVATRRWIALNWDGEDVCDHAHPAHVAALDEASPAWKLTEARCALGKACWRYRIATGNNGLALAREVIECEYGAELAEYALAPLLKAAAVGAEIDNLIAGDTPEPELVKPGPEPTPAQQRAGAKALAEWMLSPPGMDTLASALGTLLGAIEVEGASSHVRATADALAAVAESIGEVLRGGSGPENVQAALDWWAAATCGPRITVAVGE